MVAVLETFTRSEMYAYSTTLSSSDREEFMKHYVDKDDMAYEPHEVVNHIINVYNFTFSYQEHSPIGSELHITSLNLGGSELIRFKNYMLPFFAVNCGLHFELRVYTHSIRLKMIEPVEDRSNQTYAARLLSPVPFVTPTFKHSR